MSIYSFNKPEELKKEEPKENLSEQETSSIDKLAVQEGQKTDKEKIIVVDGPLSEVYTKALNIALANESVMVAAAAGSKGTSTATRSRLTNQSFTEDDKEDASYVYALGDQIMNEELAMEAYNSISKAVKSGKYKKVHMAVENVSSSMCKRLSFVIEGAMGMGVNMIIELKKNTGNNINKLTATIK